MARMKMTALEKRIKQLQSGEVDSLGDERVAVKIKWHKPGDDKGISMGWWGPPEHDVSASILNPGNREKFIFEICGGVETSGGGRGLYYLEAYDPENLIKKIGIFKIDDIAGLHRDPPDLEQRQAASEQAEMVSQAQPSSLGFFPRSTGRQATGVTSSPLGMMTRFSDNDEWAEYRRMPLPMQMKYMDKMFGGNMAEKYGDDNPAIAKMEAELRAEREKRERAEHDARESEIKKLNESILELKNKPPDNGKNTISSAVKDLATPMTTLITAWLANQKTSSEERMKELEERGKSDREMYKGMMEKGESNLKFIMEMNKEKNPSKEISELYTSMVTSQVNQAKTMFESMGAMATLLAEMGPKDSPWYDRIIESVAGAIDNLPAHMAQFKNVMAQQQGGGQQPTPPALQGMNKRQPSENVEGEEQEQEVIEKDAIPKEESQQQQEQQTTDKKDIEKKANETIQATLQLSFGSIKQLVDGNIESRVVAKTTYNVLLYLYEIGILPIQLVGDDINNPLVFSEPRKALTTAFPWLGIKIEKDYLEEIVTEFEGLCQSQENGKRVAIKAEKKEEVQLKPKKGKKSNEDKN